VFGAAVGAREGGAGHAQAAGGGIDPGVGPDRQAVCCAAVGRSWVGDGGDFDAGVGKVAGGGVAAVVGGEDDGPGAGLHRPAGGVGAGGAGQHDARTVVMGEDQRPFDGAGGEHDLPGAQFPQQLPRAIRGGGWQMVGQARAEADEVLGEITEGGGARQERDVVARAQGGNRVGEPNGGGCVADGEASFGQQAAAELGLLVGDDHLRAGLRGGEGGGEAGGAGADHQHVAEGVALGVVVRVGQCGCRAEAGGAADQWFVESMP
jgi:hypothetical protein